MRSLALRSFHRVSLLILPILLTLPVSAAAAARSVAFEPSSLLAAARELPQGEALRIAAVPLSIEGKDRLRDLDLERFEIFAPNAKVVVHTESGEKLLPIPANVYLRGKIAGDPRSRVVVSVLETGEIRGLATSTGRFWLLGAGVGESFLAAREVDSLEMVEEDGGFRCELDNLGTAAYRADDEEHSLAGLLEPGSLARSLRAVRGTFDHTAVVAIETDNEFLNLGPIGGNTLTATNYIADLLAFASTIYIDEVQTSWSLGHVSLWQVADPYAQTSACGLLEFGREWNLSNTAVTRTTAHFLSGKNSNAGVAWIGVLCSGPFSTSPANLGTTCSAPVSGTGSFGGAYGFTAGIDANFNINSPSIVWDILAFTHEIGHNFNSGHTHCYQNIGGNAASVDNCNASQCGQSGCYCGATSLPAGCPGAGLGCGTIMSYCHLISPGQSNTSLTLGLGHPFGVAPERVPNRMRDHVVSRAAANPSCLAPINVTEIFTDGFESGNTAAWN